MLNLILTMTLEKSVFSVKQNSLNEKYGPSLPDKNTVTLKSVLILDIVKENNAFYLFYCFKH